MKRLPSDTVIGQYFQLAAIHITRVLVAVYVAGYVTGQSIHRLNDRLSSFVTRLYQ